MRFSLSLAVFTVVLFAAPVFAQDPGISESGESALLTNTRQLTFEGKRSGEGYFNRNGSMMVFQSEREADNPFYQIYLLDMETGDTARVSPGFGKTTCAWIHPTAKKVMFASTHGDKRSKQLQQDELDFRASGQERRYSWDYDEHFEIYEAEFDGSNVKQLTDALGYDAEGSYSPDGSLIAFASNRHAYSEPLNEDDAQTFEIDKSYMMDIYIMNADGSKVRRLTTTPGYDGGPFFSPDGKRITWRRFAPNGATAEIYTMKIDGSDQRKLTNLGVMSWAPYYHPSGDYLIFTNNSQGFANFELYIVDAEGAHEPVRATYTPGFDGLPVFTPDGTGLAWTTNRAKDQSQIFMANWNDAEARRLLGIDASGAPAQAAPPADFTTTSADITTEDMRAYIEYLADPALEGRGTGTRGETLATQYAADFFATNDIAPAGNDGTYFQEFEFTAGVSLGDDNTLRANGEAIPADQWRPISFSKTGDIEAQGVVFAGYGIQAPAKEAEGDDEALPEYDSFVHLDVTDQWVMVLRYMPEDVSDAMRRHLSLHSSLRFKAKTLRDLGAAGMIVVSGPETKVKNELVPLVMDGSLEYSMPAVSLTNAVAENWLAAEGRDLAEIQRTLDTGDMMMGFPLEKLGGLGGVIDIQQEVRTARNVVARLNAGDTPRDSVIVIGAHIDHLGVGRPGSSLAREEDAEIHYGADDNASGVAGVLEIAQYLAEQKRNGLAMKHDVIFAGWTGEEINLLGSKHFVNHYPGVDEGDPLSPHVAAYLNMDMIGRLDKALLVQGVASSPIWTAEIERRNIPVGLPLNLQDEPYLPTDAMSFYLRGVPILNAFTGAHEDYHTPRDTPDKINYDGARDVAKFMGLIARGLVQREGAPEYAEVQKPENLGQRANLQAYLGTIPDYATEIKGLPLSGVAKGGPADKAGVRGGDIIVELAGRKVENIYDYTFAIEALKVGEETGITVQRDGERVELRVTPGARE